MPRDPVVSVLMPVRDGARFLGAALASILGQTFDGFELIVVDDASTDATAEIVRGHRDSRLAYLCNETPAGLPKSLNRALDAARGEYLARMDGDDVAAPERLAAQVGFLEANPEVGVLGTACRLIDETGAPLRTVDMPATDLAIRWRSLIGNPFLHPTVMLRRAVVEKGGLRYDESLATAQDYELWLRLLARARGANLAEPFLSLRVHAGSMSATRAADQAASHARIALRAIGELWPDHPFDEGSFSLLRRLLTEMRPLAGADDRERCRLLEAYIELLHRFGARHGADAVWAGLRRREAVATAFLVLFPPWRPGLREAIRRLSAVEPRPAAAFLAWAAGALVRRLLSARPARKKDYAP